MNEVKVSSSWSIGLPKVQGCDARDVDSSTKAGT